MVRRRRRTRESRRARPGAGAGAALRPPTLGVAALATALALGACGGSGAATSSGSRSRSSTTMTVTTTSQSTSSTVTAGAAAVGPCLTRHLRLTAASAGAAAGTSFHTYALTNVGAAPCSMSGYPGVAMVDPGGQVVQHPAKRGAAVDTPVRLVILRAGRRATFLVSSTDVIPSPGCPRSFAGVTLQVYPPNQRMALRLSRTFAFCNLRVGPVQRG